MAYCAITIAHGCRLALVAIQVRLFRTRPHVRAPSAGRLHQQETRLPARVLVSTINHFANLTGRVGQELRSATLEEEEESIPAARTLTVCVQDN